MREIVNREVKAMIEKSTRDRAEEVAAQFLKLVPRLPNVEEAGKENRTI